MQHLKEYGINADDDHLQVSIKFAWAKCCPGPDRQIRNGHQSSFNDFKRFPYRHGWTVLDDFTLQQSEERDMPVDPYKPSEPLSMNNLVQSWLFFGLINCVVQNGEPLIKPQQLNRDGVVDTKDLPAALEMWFDHERKHPRAAKLRLIQAEFCLELARQVVQANLVRPSNNGVDPLVALSIMVLGETLSAVKEQITEGLGAKVNGWHREDGEGWGPPAYVFNCMEEWRWCSRTRRILRSQLGSNATLLVAALQHGNSGEGHERCSEDVCLKVLGHSSETPVPENGEIKYRAQHGSGCKCEEIFGPNSQNIPTFGPDMKEVFRILNEANDITEQEMFPIFRLKTSVLGDLIRIDGVTVEPWADCSRRGTRKPDFATISHVWAQGMGNSYENKLLPCQVDYLRRLLGELRPTQSENTAKLSAPFWLDTFAIPVRDQSIDLPENFDNLKKRSMRQIQHAFREAKHTIVIDRDIRQYKSPAEASMKILTSTWMRRLWTLQEAFLSKGMSVTFKTPQEDPTKPHDLRDLDVIFRRLDEIDHNNSLKMAIFKLAKRRLHQGIMGEERDAMKRNAAHTAKNYGSMLIANAWRSARWRSTTRATDETLALATLLSLDFRGSDIDEEGSDRLHIQPDHEKMMCAFWRLIATSLEGSIPSGMIFLRGTKVQIRGFGWAPMTWMVEDDEDHPYPLRNIGSPTRLHEKYGLLVQYPGFLIHCPDLEPFLGSGNVPQEFEFPVDNSLLEWYRASDEKLDSVPLNGATLKREISEPKERISQEQLVNYIEKVKPMDFAIILSRPRPKARPAEVGLLVAIDNKIQRSEAPDPVKHTIYCCRIIRRVKISRIEAPKMSWVMDASSDRQFVLGYSVGKGSVAPPPAGSGADNSALSLPRLPSVGETPSVDGEGSNNGSSRGIDQSKLSGAPFTFFDRQRVIGEATDENQKWYVDGYLASDIEKSWGARKDTSKTAGLEKASSKGKAAQQDGGSQGVGPRWRIFRGLMRPFATDSAAATSRESSPGLGRNLREAPIVEYKFGRINTMPPERSKSLGEAHPAQLTPGKRGMTGD